MVSLMDADDIIAEVQKHRLFYSYSGGGITFSGGEASSQPELLDYLSEQLYDAGYSLAIETCGCFDFDRVKASLERMDTVFIDIKHMDPDEHRRWTGVSNELILRNVARLAELDAEVVVRIPVIEGVNADPENIRRAAQYVHNVLPNPAIELLPYHSLGRIKYEALGIPYNHPEFSTPTKEHMKRLEQIIEEEGVRIVSFK